MDGGLNLGFEVAAGEKGVEDTDSVEVEAV